MSLSPKGRPRIAFDEPVEVALRTDALQRDPLDFSKWEVPEVLVRDLASVVQEVAHRLDGGASRLEVVRHARGELEQALASAFPGCAVFLFGSCVYTGLWDGVSDVDFALVKLDRFARCKWPGDREKDLVIDACEALKRAGLASLVPLTRAHVPIVKHDAEGAPPREGVANLAPISFDLCLREVGVRNSLLLRAYLEQNRAARMGNAFVKYWAKRSGVIDSRHGYLTSYAVAVLWCSYLLRVKKVVYVDPEGIEARPPPDAQAAAERSTHMVTRGPLFGDDSDAIDAARLVISFFQFVAFSFDWSSDAASLRSRTGFVLQFGLRWIHSTPGSSPAVWSRVRPADSGATSLCIEDPYEDRNLAFRLSPEMAMTVRRTFYTAALLSVVTTRATRILDLCQRPTEGDEPAVRPSGSTELAKPPSLSAVRRLDDQPNTPLRLRSQEDDEGGSAAKRRRTTSYEYDFEC